MNILKNKVEAYNELVTTMNNIMPKIVKVFEETAPNWRKKDGNLLKKVKDRLDPLLGQHGKVTVYVNVGPYSVNIEFKTHYPCNEYTCDYVWQQYCVVADSPTVAPWEPVDTVSFEAAEKFLAEKETVKNNIQVILDRFYSKWDFLPYVFKGNALRLKED